jgi:hypothetical protein
LCGCSELNRPVSIHVIEGEFDMTRTTARASHAGSNLIILNSKRVKRHGVVNALRMASITMSLMVLAACGG